MINKIDLFSGGVQPPDKAKEKGGSEQTGGITPRDKVSLSDKGKEIARLQTEVSKLPDIRQDRVDSVKNAINSGTYNVKGEAVAGKMLKEGAIDSVI